MKLESLLRGKDRFYIMHMSMGINNRRESLWNYAKDKQIIGLDHSFVRGNWKDNSFRNSAIDEGLSIIWQRQFDTFYDEMKPDDIVVILAGYSSILGVAKIPENNHVEFDEKYRENDEFFEHVRKKIEWVRKYDFDKVPCQIKGFNNTLSKVERDTNRWNVLVNINLP